MFQIENGVFQTKVHCTILSDQGLSKCWSALIWLGTALILKPFRLVQRVPYPLIWYSCSRAILSALDAYFDPKMIDKIKRKVFSVRSFASFPLIHMLYINTCLSMYICTNTTFCFWQLCIEFLDWPLSLLNCAHFYILNPKLFCYSDKPTLFVKIRVLECVRYRNMSNNSIHFKSAYSLQKWNGLWKSLLSFHISFSREIYFRKRWYCTSFIRRMWSWKAPKNNMNHDLYMISWILFFIPFLLHYERYDFQYYVR